MRAAYFTPKVLAISGLLLFSIKVHAQQYSAGINTENPNTNAVLHLVAPNGDQGLLIPSLTTTQRTGMALGAADNGMLVFDNVDGLFYYWLDPSWIPLLSTDNDNQTLTIAGTNLTISNGNTVDIGVAESDPSVPANIKDGVDWTEISGIPADFADNTDDGIASVLTDATINGDGIGIPLSVNAGNGANQIVQLNASGQLPAVDGSNLTGVTSAVITDGTTITGDGSATQLAVGNIPAGQVTGLATIATTGSFGDLTLVPVGLADGDDVGLTTVTSTDIVDNEIANIDINATANIAATKLESTVMVESENVSLLNNDAGYMAASTYDPNTISGDVFDFDTHPTVTAPATGNVLTWTGTTWDAQPSTGLTLPYTQSPANAADLFYLTNTGTGGSGAFEINNAVNASNALNATTNGTGSALRVSHSGIGVGTGVDISMNQATSTGPGMRINHAGLGAGIEITTTTGPPMFITGGSAGEVLTSDALGNITLQPGGIAFPFSHTEDTDPVDLFYLDQQGINASAARFTNSTGTFTGSVVSIEGNGILGSQGLAVTQIGAGDAGNFLISGTGAGTAVYGSTTGTGQAGLFEISNATSTSPVIEVINAGVGPDIRLPTGANAGYVLTSDAAGNATWQPSGGAFTLDGNNNLTAITGATPPGTENFLVGVNSGNSLIAGGDHNTLIGNGAGQSITSGSTNIVIGLNAGGAGLTTGNGNVVIGESATVNAGFPNVVVGQGASSGGTNAVALGIGASVGGAVTGSMALGTGSDASGDNSIAIGFNTSAPQDNSAIIGDVTIPDFHVGIGTNAPTAKLTIDRASGVGDGLSVKNNGTTGRGIVIDMVAASANPDPALLVAQNADGMGADIRITNSASTTTALSVSNQGDGNVGFFNQALATSGADAMFVQTVGLGGSGVFQINNTGNAAPALSSNTNGTGRAAQFVINSATNTAPAVYASTNGTGNAMLLDHIGTTSGDALSINHSAPAGRGILIDMNGAGDQGLFIGGTNPASSSIETDGTVLFRKNFITPTFAYDVGGSGPVLPNSHRLLRITNLPDIQIDEISVAGASDGQEILLVVEAAGTNFNVTSVGSGAVNIRLDNDNTFTMRTGSSLHLVYIEPLNQWVEIGRSF